MKRYMLAVLVLSFFAVCGYAQDGQSTADQDMAPASVETATPAPAAMPTEKVVQPQEVSIYGEVKAVNPAACSFSIQYYDYDSDEEASIDIITDDITKMENAAALSDIKQGDWADVIYMVADGKNMAKSIIVEKEEEALVDMPEAEAQPAEAPTQ
jgi:hypothetical protein